MTRRRQLLYRTYRELFYPFLRRSFGMLQPAENFVPNWHLQAMAHALEQVENGTIKRLAISVPPRELKSITASVAFPAWVLGRDPSKKVISVSYSNDLSAKHARDTRRILLNDEYQSIFPDTVIDGGRNTEAEQETTAGGFRLATSVNGTLTGRGGNIIIIDDPIKPDDVLSEVERNNVNDWYERTLLSRLDNPNDDAIVIVMQRVHEDDLIGHLTAVDDHDWTILKIPAIAAEDQEYRIGNRPEDVYLRQAGEVINAQRMSLPTLEQRRTEVGSQIFASQYQQDPTPFEGNMIKRRWLHYYDECHDLNDFNAIFQSWDTATETGELNSFSVCTTWGVLNQYLYLIDVYRQKPEFPELNEVALNLAQDFGAHVILIEGASSGHSLRQNLRSVLNAKVIKIRPVSDKEMRLYSVSHMFENGRVLLPRDAPWLDRFERELLGFPGVHDKDQVDSVSQFLRHAHGLAIGRLRFDANGQRIRPNPKRRSGRRRVYRGKRAVPIDLFGSSGGGLL